MQEAATAAKAAAAAAVGAEPLVTGFRLGWGLGTLGGCTPATGAMGKAPLSNSNLGCACSHLGNT